MSKTYQDITQGHLSKNSCWIDVYIGGDVPESELRRLLGNSYDLIKPKKVSRK